MLKKNQFRTIHFFLTKEFIVKSLLGNTITFFTNKGWKVKIYCHVENHWDFCKTSDNNDMIEVLNIPFSRKISLFNDIYCLIYLIYKLFRERGIFVYSTPKASLITSFVCYFLLKKKIYSVHRERPCL